jgi:hypothetical protein
MVGFRAIVPAGFVPMAFLEGRSDDTKIYRGQDMAAMFLLQLPTGPKYTGIRLPD